MANGKLKRQCSLDGFCAKGLLRRQQIATANRCDGVGLDWRKLAALCVSKSRAGDKALLSGDGDGQVLGIGALSFDVMCGSRVLEVAVGLPGYGLCKTRIEQPIATVDWMHDRVLPHMAI